MLLEKGKTTLFILETVVFIRPNFMKIQSCEILPKNIKIFTNLAPKLIDNELYRTYM